MSAGEHHLNCANASLGSLDVVVENWSPLDFLRTICGPLRLLTLGDRRFDPSGIATINQDGQKGQPIVTAVAVCTVRAPRSGCLAERVLVLLG